VKGRISYIVGVVLSTVLLLGVGPCSDQGTRFSFEALSNAAYSTSVEDEYERLLQSYVDSENLIRYSAWKKNSEDVASLRAILESMARTNDATLSPQRKMAFYINAYNAMTIDLILSHYDESLGGASSPMPGVRSIRNIEGLDWKVWDHFKWNISGKQRTLNEVEHQILRPMGDARIHFAIVCASMGCPPIHPIVFREAALDENLDQLSDAFVNSGRNTTFDPANHKIHTSHILDWFGEDFVAHFGSVKEFFSRYVQVVTPSEIDDYSIQFDDYDWTLNESESNGLEMEREF